MGSHYDGAIINISKNITHYLGKGKSFMAQIRRGELPPLRDPRTLGNRHKRNAPQPPSMRKNQDAGTRRGVTRRQSPRVNIPSRAVPIVPQGKSHGISTQKSTSPTTQPDRNKRGAHPVQRNVPASYSTHRNPSGNSSGNTHSKKPASADSLKNHVRVTNPKDTQGKSHSDSTVASQGGFTSVKKTTQDTKQNTSIPDSKNTVKQSEEKRTVSKKDHDDNNVHYDEKKSDFIKDSDISTKKDYHSEKSQRDAQGKNNVPSDKTSISIDHSVVDSDKEENSKKSKFKTLFNHKKIKGYNKADKSDSVDMSDDNTDSARTKHNHSVSYDEDGAPLEKPRMSVHPVKEKVKRHDPNAASAIDDIKGYNKDASRYDSKSQIEENTENSTEDTTEDTDIDSTYNSKIIVPKSNIDTKKRKKPIFLIFVNIWVFLIVIAIIVLTSLGFVWWNNTSLEKQKSIAYNQGYQNAFDKPTVDSIVRNSATEISDLILSTPGNGYPSNAVLSDFHLEGWTTPGGNEGHGRANIAVCYTGDGVNEALQSYVYLVSDNSGAQHPKWSVDSIHVTGDKCVPQKEGK